VLRVVNAIARTDIDLQLRDALLKVSVLARIAIGKALDPCLNSSTTVKIFEAIKPVREMSSRFDLSHKPDCIPWDTNCKNLNTRGAVSRAF
jgi:hypothetical protein